MKALKAFRDGNKKRIAVGDTLKAGDYSDQKIKDYISAGLIAAPKVTKPAKPKVTKNKKK